MTTSDASPISTVLPTSLIDWFYIYTELTKAKLSILVLLTTVAGFVLGSARSIDVSALLWTVLGTAFAAAGSSGLNQLWEKDLDAKMERTRTRPLPSGRVGSGHVIVLSLALSLSGVGILALRVNLLTAFLAALTIVLYIFFYTPLKTRTSLCTLAGALCGAIPPMIGWTGATGVLSPGAWVLAAILFVWQIPHFLALAWLYREDYERGGFRMLPLTDHSGWLTTKMAVLYSLALLPVAATLSLVGVTGWIFAAGSLLLGGMMLAAGLKLDRQKTTDNARRLFLVSIIYLPILLGLMVFDRPLSPRVETLPIRTSEESPNYVDPSDIILARTLSSAQSSCSDQLI